MIRHQDYNELREGEAAMALTPNGPMLLIPYGHEDESRPFKSVVCERPDGMGNMYRTWRWLIEIPQGGVVYQAGFEAGLN